MTSNPSEIAAAIKAAAKAIGFDVVRFTSADTKTQAAEGLTDFVAQGRHGDMTWMKETADRRSHPQRLWPDAKSIIVLGLNYGPDHDPMESLAHTDRGVISVYARNRDYHDVIKKRLKRLGRWMAAQWSCELKVFVDTAPVMEKPLAQAAGVGWQGKHTNVVSRDFGSWLFLGEVFTTLELPVDPTEGDHCGQCQNCLDICPTKAFPAPYQLDARRCISYLTIEHKGQIAPEFRKPMGNRIYGCDDCLAVCPWNKFAQLGTTDQLLPRDDLTGPKLSDLAQLDDADFRAYFSGSPIKRIGRDRFVRNVLVAIGNADDPSLRPIAEGLLNDSSPLVRGMAVWAVGQIASVAEVQALKAVHEPNEADPDVLKEWSAV